MERWLRITFPAALAVCMVVGSARAQGSELLVPGARVRVAVESPPRIIGTVIEPSGNTLTLAKADSSDTLAVKYAAITRLDVSLGKRHRMLHSTAVGALMGAAVGFGAGALVDATSKPTPVVYSVDGQSLKAQYPPFIRRTLTGAGIGAVAGALVGAVWGQTHVSEVWRRIPYRQYRMHIAVIPAGWRGATLAFAISR